MSDAATVLDSSPEGTSADVLETVDRVEVAATDVERIVFFDGVCVFCNGAVSFIHERDHSGLFHFASLQGATAARWRSKLAGVFPDDIDTMVLLDLTGQSPRLTRRSRAALEIARRLPAPISWVSVLRHLPAALTDVPYRVLAALRYRLFGRFDECPLPSPELRKRTLP